jgi:hypothetical protein
MTAQEALYKIRVMLGVEDTNEEVALETETDTEEVKLAETTLVDGTVVKTEGEFEVGKQLFVVTDEGDIPAPEGLHETSEGVIIGVDAEGIIVSIEEPAEEEVVVEESEQFSDDVINKIVGALSPKFDDLQNQINTIKGEFSEFKDGPATERIKNNLNALNKAEQSIQDTRMATILEMRKQSFGKNK